MGWRRWWGSRGGGQTEETFDGRSLRWARAALERLKGIEDPYRRSRARLRVEKAARLAKTPIVTLEFALRHLGDALPNATPGRGGSQG